MLHGEGDAVLGVKNDVQVTKGKLMLVGRKSSTYEEVMGRYTSKRREKREILEKCSLRIEIRTR
jgi:hypothetical protein